MLKKTFLAVVLLSISLLVNTALAIEFSPPFTNVSVVHADSDTNMLAGVAGYNSDVNTDTGKIVQTTIAFAGPPLGGAGARVADAIIGGFTVPTSGEYTVEFSGNVTKYLQSIGATKLLGVQKSVFDIDIKYGIQGGPLYTEVIEEAELTARDFLDDVAHASVSNLLDWAAPSATAGSNLKTGIEIVHAAQTIMDNIPEVGVDKPFTLSVTTWLSAGSYSWWFDLRSQTISTAIGLAGVYANAVAICDLESVTVTPSEAQYTITASSGLNGSIDPEGSIYVEQGNSQTFNATPNSGYEVDRWLTEAGGSALQDGGSSYFASNIQADTTIYVTFKWRASPVGDTKTLTSVADSYTVETDPSGNRGTLSQLGITSAASIGTRQYGFVKFDISSIPAGSVITYVELKLYSYWYDHPDTNTWLGAIGQDWSETGVTWYNQPGSASGLSIFKKFSSDGYHTWSSSSYPDLNSLIQTWIDGTKSNYGFYLTRDQGYIGDTAYRTREWGTSDQRPKLIVTYTPPPQPDLIITNLSPDPSPANNTYYVGQSVDWQVAVKNNGIGPAGSSEVGYYLGNSPDDLNTPLSPDPSDNVDALNAGQSASESSVYTFRSSDVGQKYLICLVDKDAEVDESVEENNKWVYGPFNVVFDLSDAISTLQILSGQNPQNDHLPNYDVDGDGRIGMAEILFVLQSVSTGDQQFPDKAQATQ